MHTLKFLGLQPTCVIKILHKIVSLNWRKTHCHYIGWLTIKWYSHIINRLL